MGSFSLSLIFVIIVVIMAVFLFIFRNFFFGTVEKKEKVQEPLKKKEPCILCGAILTTGETLKSEEYKGEHESMVYVRGCPYCTGVKDDRERICPVCKKPVSRDEYLIARMWTKKNGRKHLHVSGCTNCSRLLKNHRPGSNYSLSVFLFL
jgi:predicted amidophosphoribosyltransferase